jgi:hypothetical protein
VERAVARKQLAESEEQKADRHGPRLREEQAAYVP